jgi:hypothetical protein
MMRNCILVTAAVAALVSGTAIPHPALAMSLSAPHGARAAADAINPIETAALEIRVARMGVVSRLWAARN